MLLSIVEGGESSKELSKKAFIVDNSIKGLGVPYLIINDLEGI